MDFLKMSSLEGIAMYLEPVSKKDITRLKNLYEEAFPEDERAPFWMLKKRAFQNRADFWNLYDNDTWTGMAYVVTHADLAYVFYFAIDKKLRGQHYGTAAIKAILEQYPDKRVFLALEDWEERCENKEQRTKRHDFYLRCGLKDLPYRLQEATVTYRIMGVGTAVQAEEYKAMMDDYIGWPVKYLVPMRIVKDRYLQDTKMLDYTNPNIQRLIERKGWKKLSEFERIKSIYNFVRDEILFGYNIDDRIPASKVLRDGYGQCNTKGTLFMAILRALEIPCRVHGFTIDKKLQKGAMTGFVYKSAPQNVFHSWVEVYFEDKWYELEAFILDRNYLTSLQAQNAECTGAFCGFGVAVKDFQNPVIDFDRNNTYIQSEGINQDFGVYDSPDELLKEHHQEMSFIKSLAYRYLGRHLMNYNVKKIRKRMF
jgi:GNAT superfamily N-acetyltransferase